MEASYEGNKHRNVCRSNAANWNDVRSRRDQGSLKVRSWPSNALLRTGEIRLRAGTTPSPRCNKILHAGLQDEAPVDTHALAALSVGRGRSDKKLSRRRRTMFRLLPSPSRIGLAISRRLLLASLNEQTAKSHRFFVGDGDDRPAGPGRLSGWTPPAKEPFRSQAFPSHHGSPQANAAAANSSLILIVSGEPRACAQVRRASLDAANLPVSRRL